MLMNLPTNVENILRVADYLDDLPDPSAFSMFFFQWPSMGEAMHPCGTPSCIAGYACHVHGIVRHGYDTMEAAQMLFGLSEENARLLFLPEEDRDGRNFVNRFNINNTQAAQLLRHLATTGLVDWSILGPDYA